jgi:hypothetical protein
LAREKWEAGQVKKKGSERGGAVRAVAPGRGQKPMVDSGRSLCRDSEAVVSSLGVGGQEKRGFAGKHGGEQANCANPTHWPRYNHVPNGKRPRHF